MCTETKVLYDHDTSEVDKYHGFKLTVPLYTAPPAPRKPLTDEEIQKALSSMPLYASEWKESDYIKFARAIEDRIRSKT